MRRDSRGAQGELDFSEGSEIKGLRYHREEKKGKLMMVGKLNHQLGSSCEVFLGEEGAMEMPWKRALLPMQATLSRYNYSNVVIER